MCGIKLMKPMKTTEAEDRIQENLDNFENRLFNSWPIREGKDKPKVHIHPQIRDPPRDSSQHGDMQHGLPDFTSPQDKKVDSHRWIECMKKFSNEFRQIKELREAQNKVDPGLGIVMVALIDDGKFLQPH